MKIIDERERKKITKNKNKKEQRGDTSCSENVRINDFVMRLS